MNKLDKKLRDLEDERVKAYHFANETGDMTWLYQINYEIDCILEAKKNGMLLQNT